MLYLLVLARDYREDRPAVISQHKIRQKSLTSPYQYCCDDTFNIYDRTTADTRVGGC